MKKSIPKDWLNELESENSTKTAVKTNKILYIKIQRKNYKTVIHKIYIKL